MFKDCNPATLYGREVCIVSKCVESRDEGRQHNMDNRHLQTMYRNVSMKFVGVWASFAVLCPPPPPPTNFGCWFCGYTATCHGEALSQDLPPTLDLLMLQEVID